MDIRTFTKHQLYKFVHSEEYNKLINVPISKHRAISQCNNPRAHEDDILLIAVFDSNKTLGYIGILPDYLYLENKTIKIGWLSGFRTEYSASNNVAALLFTKLIRSWRNKLVITNIAPYLENAYQSLGLFNPIEYKQGLRVYLRSDLAGILPPKKKFFKNIKPLLSIIDNVINYYHYPFINLISTSKIKNQQINEVDRIDNEITEFINKIASSQITRRGVNEINWILNNKWVKPAEEIINNQEYYFSAYSNKFYYKKYVLKDINNNITGFFIISIRDNKISIPLLYVENKYYTMISDFIMKFMIRNKLSTLTVFDNKLKHHFKKFKFPFVIKKQIVRPYFVSKELQSIDIKQFQDGDGDVIFT